MKVSVRFLSELLAVEAVLELCEESLIGKPLALLKQYKLLLYTSHCKIHIKNRGLLYQSMQYFSICIRAKLQINSKIHVRMKAPCHA